MLGVRGRLQSRKIESGLLPKFQLSRCSCWSASCLCVCRSWTASTFDCHAVMGRKPVFASGGCGPRSTLRHPPPLAALQATAAATAKAGAEAADGGSGGHPACRAALFCPACCDGGVCGARAGMALGQDGGDPVGAPRAPQRIGSAQGGRDALTHNVCSAHALWPMRVAATPERRSDGRTATAYFVTVRTWIMVPWTWTWDMACGCDV